MSRSLMPLFEAIVNSIHAIEEAGRPMEQGRIRVEILRDLPQKTLSAGKKGGGGLAPRPWPGGLGEKWATPTPQQASVPAVLEGQP
jgi:hypothetical protein